EIDVTVPREGAAVLRLDVEPGPGMGQRQMLLEIFDGPVLAATAAIDRRSDVRISLAASEAAERRLRLRAGGGGDPVAHDPRILNFRVFSCVWGEASAAAPLPAAEGPEPAVIAPVPASRRLGVLWRGFQHLMTLLATGGPL